LTEAAQYFAAYFAANDEYGHRADGSRPSERAAKFGYDYCLVSENIAYQFSSTSLSPEEIAERFVKGWKDSSEHRENMLDEDVFDTGVAVARSVETGYWYAVQMFGRPATAAIEFKIASQAETVVEYRVGERTFELESGFTRTHKRCRRSDVTFILSERPDDTKTFEPKNGDSYTVVSANDRLEVHEGSSGPAKRSADQ
jgi:hypothetical protein